MKKRIIIKVGKLTRFKKSNRRATAITIINNKNYLKDTFGNYNCWAVASKHFAEQTT